LCKAWSYINNPIKFFFFPEKQKRPENQKKERKLELKKNDKDQEFGFLNRCVARKVKNSPDELMIYSLSNVPQKERKKYINRCQEEIHML
jgi:hypothetical protein